MRPFSGSDGGTVLAWVRSPEELDAWASRTDLPLPLSVFAQWHADPDVHPFVLKEGDVLVAYGEVWEDAAEREAELARIIVAPESRGRGVGRKFVGLLAREARGRGYDEVWLRVLPGNEPALACYRRAGFRRVRPDEEKRFNREQPREYVWMRLSA